MIPDVKRIAIVALALIVAGCYWSQVKEQRTTEGPLAEDIWTMKVLMVNGREPNFDERRRWDNVMEQRIGQYLRDHPEAANSMDVSTFKFIRQVSVGQSSEQVLILLGPPMSRTADQPDMQQLTPHSYPSAKHTKPT